MSASPMEASTEPIPTPADSDTAIALSEDTAPEAAMDITSWSATAVTANPRRVSVSRLSVRNKSFTLSKVKSSLKEPSESRVWLSSPPIMPSRRGEEVRVVSVSTFIDVWPSAVTDAPSFTCAFVSPRNTAAPTAPARATPPAEKLAAGSIIKISVSSPACSLTEPEV